MVGSATMKIREAKPVRNWPMTALVRRSRSIPGTGAPYHTTFLVMVASLLDGGLLPEP